MFETENDLELITKYYKNIGDIKQVVGKLDVLNLYLNKISNDEILLSGISNVISDLNNILGEENHKSIEILKPNCKTDNVETKKYYWKKSKTSKKVEQVEKTEEIKTNSACIADKLVDNKVIRQSFNSSNLDNIAYYRQSQHLVVQFQNKRQYEYLRVPENIVLELIKSESAGRYFNRNIQKNYECNEMVKLS